MANVEEMIRKLSEDMAKQTNAIKSQLTHQTVETDRRFARLEEGLEVSRQEALEAMEGQWRTHAQALLDHVNKTIDGRFEARLGGNGDGPSRRQERRPTHNSPPSMFEGRGTNGRTNGTRSVDLDEDSLGGTPRRGPTRGRVDDELQGIKFSIPAFRGSSDPNEFLEWKGKMELIFACHEYSDFKKVQMAIVEFRDYALTWWEKTRRDWARLGAPPIDTWRALIRAMEARFIPPHYLRDLHLKLQGLNQGSKSVEEYHKEMELLIMRAQIDESEEVTMARFVDGLRRDIRDIVELQTYRSMDDLVQLAIKVEGQVRRRSQRIFPKSGPFPPKDFKGKMGQSNVNRDIKVEAAATSKPKDSPKFLREVSNPKSKEVTCFKCNKKGHYASNCPSKRTLVLHENGSYEFIDSFVDHASDQEDDDHEGEYDCNDSAKEDEGYSSSASLVNLRTLSVIPKEEAPDRVKEQRENLFHCRCKIRGRNVSVIIDNGSCTNVVSWYTVKKLGLSTLKHPHPYKLQWMNESGELKVTRQANVPIALGCYEEDVLCDVSPMNACHLLLGRPWQSDRAISYDGRLNRISFHHNGTKIVISSLSLKEVRKDQENLKKRMKEAEALHEADVKKEDSKGTSKDLILQESHLLCSYKECKREVDSDCFGSLFFLVCKDAILDDENQANDNIPFSVARMLDSMKDVYLDELPKGLPRNWERKNHIDFAPSALIPNREAYKFNPQDEDKILRIIFLMSFSHLNGFDPIETLYPDIKDFCGLFVWCHKHGHDRVIRFDDLLDFENKFCVPNLSFREMFHKEIREEEYDGVHNELDPTKKVYSL